MRKLSSILACAFMAFALCTPFNKAMSAEVILKDGKAFTVIDGKQSPLDSIFPVVPLEKLSLIAVGVDKDEDNPKLTSGFYIFKKGDEKPVTFIPYALSSGLSAPYAISPDKKILALNFSMATWGKWVFLSLPDLKFMGDADYYSINSDLPIFVDSNGKKGVLLGQYDPKATFTDERKPQYDPGFAESVAYYDFATKKTTTLMKGTALCNYRVKGFEKGEAIIDALCQKKVEDWNHWPDNLKPTQIKKKI